MYFYDVLCTYVADESTRWVNGRDYDDFANFLLNLFDGDSHHILHHTGLRG